MVRLDERAFAQERIASAAKPMSGRIASASRNKLSPQQPRPPSGSVSSKIGTESIAGVTEAARAAVVESRSRMAGVGNGTQRPDVELYLYGLAW